MIAATDAATAVTTAATAVTTAATATTATTAATTATTADADGQVTTTTLAESEYGDGYDAGYDYYYDSSSREGTVEFKTVYEGNPLRIDCRGQVLPPAWEIDASFLKLYTSRKLFKYDDDYSDVDRVNQAHARRIIQGLRSILNDSFPDDIMFSSSHFVYIDYMVMRRDNQTYSLLFREIHCDATGTYRCIGENGSVVSTTYVNVIPNITRSAISRFIRRGRVGSDLILFNVSLSNHVLDRFIYLPTDRDTTDQTEALLNRRIKVIFSDVGYPKHSIVITNLQLSDAGFYVTNHWEQVVEMYDVTVTP